MRPCHLCGTEEVNGLLDLGMQPICNRFLTNPVDKEYTHRMIIGQCNSCGLIQAINPVPASELLPCYDWITYNEPEGHLDQMCEIVLSLPGITRESTVCGVSFKDDSTLSRIKRRGVKHIWRIDPKDDLGINDSGAGVETIQEFLTPEIADTIAQNHSIADAVIARHILEHAHDIHRFIQALKQLVNPKGYIIFEVPDCTRALENCDYTTLWEEHILYFTPETFRNYFAYSGFPLYRFKSYPYPFENSLVGIAQAQGQAIPSFSSENILRSERRRARLFAENFPKHVDKFKEFLSGYRQSKGKIALFGAGHLACTFINLLGLKDFIDFCVDDNPNKQGLFLPGSHLPIYGSSALIKENIKLCLLSLSPMSEEKIMQINQNFLAKGGTFLSIFPASKHALRI